MISKQIATLAFVIGTCDWAIGVHPGRVRSKLKQLKKHGEKAIAPFNTPLYDSDWDKAKRILSKWGDVSGWEEKNRKLPTVISFLADLIGECFPGSRMEETVNELFEYFDRAKKAPVACCWAGGLAADRLRGCAG